MKNPNAKSGEYYVESDDSVLATFVTRLRDAKNVTVQGRQVTYSTYRPALSYNLEMAEIEQSRIYNTPIDIRVVRRMVRKIWNKMNSFAWVGDSEYGVGGVVDSISSMTTSVGADISAMTTPSAIANTFIKAFQDLPAKYRENYTYNLVMPDAVLKYVKQIGNQTNDKSAFNQILDSISQVKSILPEGQLDEATATGGGSTVAKGIAFFVPTDEDATRIPIGYLPRNHMEAKPKDQEIDGSGEARMGPVELTFPEAYLYVTTLLG